MISDQHYMSLALALATKGRLTTSPNPMVGCLIVKNNQMIAEGYHQYAGCAHAEIIALQMAGKQAENADLYVTLEPCCHTNRTPPCTEALIAAKVKRVIIATEDPNPKVSGKGILALKNAGIQVVIGICEEEAKQLNEVFFHYIQQGRPFVIAKWAMSLDGKMVTQEKDSPNISCVESRKHTHQTRQQVDAIIIGATTAIKDDPALTVRYTDAENIKQPIRIVVSSNGDLPQDLQIFNDKKAKTIIATTKNINTEIKSTLEKKEIEVLLIKQNDDGQVDILDLLNQLGTREITSVLLEGGRTLQENFFKEGLVNRVHVYLAPVIIATLPNKKSIPITTITSIDHDYWIDAKYED